jgi:hypothetical protein
MLVLVRHSYGCSCSLAIEGLGFFAALAAWLVGLEYFLDGPVLDTHVFFRDGFRCQALTVLFFSGVATGRGTSAVGLVVRRVVNAAGFTPAAIAAFAAEGESGDCLIAPFKSGLTIIWRS